MNNPRNHTAFRRDLLAWYRASARAQPWRAQPSLYKTVVAEFMLQQTQVKTALPYFERWMRRLPGFEALAGAPEALVLKLWEGLGYYSRARNLHKLARAIVALPAPPRTAAAWRELPGVGPYTAAAITSITFGAREACVDGNVVRILARLTADGVEFRDSAAAARHFAPLAGRLAGGSLSPGDHNQAMMELGATVCTRQKPSCANCPVRKYCAAARACAMAHAPGPEALPRLAAKKIEPQEITRLWLVDKKRGAVLLQRAAPAARRLAGIFELPALGGVGAGAGEPTGPDAKCLKVFARQKRSITRHRITETFVELLPGAPGAAGAARRLRRQIEARAVDSGGALQWVALADLPRITLSGPHRRIVDARAGSPCRQNPVEKRKTGGCGENETIP